MTDPMIFIACVVGAVLGIAALLAQLRLFSIDESLKELVRMAKETTGRRDPEFVAQAERPAISIPSVRDDHATIKLVLGIGAIIVFIVVVILFH